VAAPEVGVAAPSGPVLFAYDGSDLAALAIDRGAEELAAQRDVIVLCVWQPVDVGFVPTGSQHFDADQAPEVRKAAEETAAYGASLAEKAGFRARALAVQAAPTWKGIIETAAEHHATLIVIGARRRRGLVGHLIGSVAAAVVAHAPSSVLVVHERT
jgi:nucleotide-binding universal stress UspA family protein